ncbi:MAG: exodeoxyribonuclease V subunit beta [Candidatus Dasytiphilus stammeri]
MFPKNAQKLNPTTIPLYGSILIEASAGTGKTHTISILYLRLLLGLRQGKKIPLKVEEILVVTFTEAATLELKNRIYSHIHELRIACMRGITNNPELMLLLSQIDDLKQAANILLTAELHLDTAAIFTIHSFCQRMLYINMIECGMMFKHQIIEDDYFLYHEIVVDFWKHHFSQLPINIAQLLLQEWSSPTSLLKNLLPWLKGELPKLKYPLSNALTLEQHHQNMLDRIRSFKKQWSLVASKLKDLIHSYCGSSRYHTILHGINKITIWSQQETETYFFPKEIKNFRKEILQPIISSNGRFILNLPIFEEIELFLSNPPSLRAWVLSKALLEIYTAVRNKNRTVLGFDDLIHLLDEALQQPSIGPSIAQRIRYRYPIALIDEFQDTDSIQYRIYKKIYIGHCDSALILIGDPKQAIYSFRGADIFSYMDAKSTMDNYYTLNTNWRSSSKMVSSINQLFSRNKNPFIFTEIPFIPVKASCKNSKLFFKINNQSQTALRFCLQPGENVSFSEYQQFMGRYCAMQIKKWIIAGQNDNAHLINGNNIRKITPADIVVLVRNQNEATVIQNALNDLKIASIYHSSRESIYSTLEARDILYLLKAILLITNNSQMLRTALATSLFGFDAQTIDKILNQEDYCDDFYQKFIHYKKIWFQHGVMPMLHELIISNKIYEKLLKNNEERRLIDILHLMELLQKASFQLDNQYALIRWLELQILQPNNYIINQRPNLEYNKNIIHIISIHKSKGLQYPLVWLPFISLFRQSTDILYHDRITLHKILDLHYNNINSKKLADEERLAEDLRILYVALTRSIWHCSIGIAPLIKGKAKKNQEEKNDLHLSAIGYLIQNGKSHNTKELVKSLKEIQSDDIEIVYTDNKSENMKIIGSPYPIIKEKTTSVINSLGLHSNFNNTIYTQDNINNYSSKIIEELFPYIDLDAVFDKNFNSSTTLRTMSPHTFPCGITSCMFLHDLFKIIDFSQPKKGNILEKIMNKYGLDLAWIPVLNEWINNILQVDIDNLHNISLSKIENHHKKNQWMFSFKLDRDFNIHNLHEVVRLYYPLTHSSMVLKKFRKNCLKGCIDLVFKMGKKYYLVDYKSIWLGKNTLAYNYQNLDKFIRDNNYDWQYILYTLAFHRYLQYYSSDYDYEINFGGVYCLFLRGLTLSKGEGIWKIRPNKKLITTLDKII